MRKYEVDNPNFSRIFIDFKNKENPVSFEFPNEQKKFKSVHKTVFSMWFSPKGFVIFSMFTLSILLIYVSTNLDVDILLMFFEIIFFMLATPYFITILFTYNKTLRSSLPKMFKLFHNNQLKRVMVKKMNSKVHELPIFENVFLEYRATKEFGKYLEKIEIVEHDFYYMSKKLFSKDFKKENNDAYWKVRFIFSKIPKKGELELEFI